MAVSERSTLFLEDLKNRQSKRIMARDVLWYAPVTRTMRNIRCVNLETGKVETTHSISASKVNGIRLLKIETECGYILECTPDTMIYMMDGYVAAKDIEVGMQLKVNGQPSDAYKNKEFLEEWYVKRHKTQKEIAEMCSTPEYPVSERTIRAWVKKFNLGRGDSGKVFGEDNPRYKGEDVTRKGLYERARFAIEKPTKCDMCGYEGDNIDYHHINHNLLDFSEENLLAICEKCHQAEHHGAVIKHVRYTRISNISPAGIDPAVSIITENGNYVAEGFIIENNT